MELRPADLDDVPRLVALMHAAIERSTGDAYDAAERARWVQRVDAERMRVILSAPRERCVVVELEGQIVAFGSRNGSLLRLLYVHPEAAGKGLGRLVMDHLESDARAAGVERMTLDASRNAVPFYARLGYVETGAAGCTTDAILCTEMAKPL